MFRLVFGIIVCLQFIKFRTVFLNSISQQIYFIKYDGFQWVELLPRPYLDYLFIVLIGASVLFTLGLLYRVAATAQFLGLAYLFLIEKSMYNNHYYLFILVAFLMIFLAADRKLSLASALALKATWDKIPFWQIFTIQLQLFMLYFFGGIAKLNYDWLVNAQPIQLWLPDMLGANYAGLSETQRLTLAYVISYSGLIIDLVGSFLLLHRRWRYYFMPFLVVFHLTNIQLFNIGYFPWFGVFSLVIFIGPEVWERWIGKYFKSSDEQGGLSLKWAAFILIPFFIWQFIFPLRHWAMAGDVRWNMKGYDFAWFMKLNDTRPIFRMQVRLPGSTESYTFDNYEVLNSSRQMLFLSMYPYDCVSYAHFVEDWLKQENSITGDIRVFCDSYVSLNDGGFQRKIDPLIDLTTINPDGMGKYFRDDNWVIQQGDKRYINKADIDEILNR